MACQGLPLSSPYLSTSCLSRRAWALPQFSPPSLGQQGGVHIGLDLSFRELTIAESKPATLVTFVTGEEEP